MILSRVTYGQIEPQSILHADGKFYRPTANEVGLEIAGGVIESDDPREVWEIEEPLPLQDWMYVKELEFSDSCKRRKLA